MQLIVFFDRKTLHTMVNLYALDAFKKMYNNDGRFFNHGDANKQKVIIVSNEGISSVLDFNESALQDDCIVMIPDEYKLKYTPPQPYIILHHSSTYSSELSGSPLSIEQESENRYVNKQQDTESLYYKIIKFIGNSKGFTFNQLIKEYIPNEDLSKIERTINYLHDCLNNEQIIQNDEFNQDKATTLATFSDIRDSLLSQCDFNQENS